MCGENERQYNIANVKYRTITDVSPSGEPITNVVLKGEEVCNVSKGGKWEIARVLCDCYLPYDEVVIVFKKKEEVESIGADT